ncbi:choline dehydrogenase-like flavoprotein [Arthrobacter sp. V4I6]|nr:choline dehydrogenase-like flavoprotein [Arthrobacter sp. V1I7]MDQ0854985.1 choline dehydrogenase-like flavoprotein [Arthrobacter sp. V4I6]
MDNAEFDFVAVGSGAGGSPLASNLARPVAASCCLRPAPAIALCSNVG